MDIDRMSIASDFSIIPESMVNAIDDGDNQSPISECENVPLLTTEESSSSAALLDTNSYFNKVTFGTIQRVANRPDRGLSVVFCHTPDFTPTKSDRIALYKVGFSSSKEFLCFEWVPAPDSHYESLSQQASLAPVPKTVIIEAASLPEDRDEFYQICYLTQSGHIAGVSVPFQLSQTEKCEMVDEIENAARNVLSIRVRELLKEQGECKGKINALESTCFELQNEKEEIAKWHNEADEKLTQFKKLSESLQQQLQSKELELEKIKMDLIEKEDAATKEQAMMSELHERLTTTVLEVNALQEKLEEVEESKAVTDERQRVLTEDNMELKACLQQIKKELEQTIKEKEAAEKIASDLSQRLQAACEEYQNLARLNVRLAKKVKKLKREIALREAVYGESFVCVSKEEQLPKDDDHEDLEEDLECREELEIIPIQSSHGDDMTTSVATTAMSASCQSNCSQNARELTEAFGKKMEDIFVQLSLQNTQIKILKDEIAKRNYSLSQQSSIISQSVECIEEPLSTGLTASSIGVVTDDPEMRSDVEQFADGHVERARESHVQREEKMVQVNSISGANENVLYANCFLPAPCTAPVFLPPPARSVPSAPSPTPSMLLNEGYSVIYAANSTQTVVDSSTHQSNVSETFLPPPLQPETTVTARNAAVLKQFTSSDETMTNDTVPHNQMQSERQQGAESDDDDYHSTGDAGDTTQRRPVASDIQEQTLECPMCQLGFTSSGIMLLEEHINSHLEKICPVCSQAFTRNTKQEEFENHVQSHFEDEDVARIPEDPSGPWGSRNGRSIQLLEID